MKILFVTFNGIEDAAFGGAKASIRNYELLQKFGETQVYTICKKSSLRSAASLLQGFFPPADSKDLQNIMRRIKEENFDVVFFDGSHFGKIVKAVRGAGIPAIVFFHNCEYDYIEVRFGKQNSLKKTVYKKMVRQQEELAAKQASRTVTFTERDAKRVQELYGVEVTDIIPLSVKDVYEARQPQRQEKVCLLFGPLGRANEEGFAWFLEKVSPNLTCKTVLAGKGFETYRETWGSEKAEIVGTVDDIAAMYADAACVAIPLFSGSGMKIKTAEALMFGKYIFGTDEAYVGYDTDAEGIGTLCNTAEEFIRGINGFMERNEGTYCEEARKLYERRYSMQASEERFQRLLEGLT